MGLNLSVTILLDRIGPYHDARLRQLSMACSVTAVEFSKIDRTYSWSSVAENGSYRVVTLFPDRDIKSVSASVLSTKMHAELTLLESDVVAIPGWSAPASLAALTWCAKTTTPAVLMSDSTYYDEPRALWKEWVKRQIVDLHSSALVAGTLHMDYVEALGLSRASAFTGYDVVDNLHFELAAERARSEAEVLRRKFRLPCHYLLASSRFIEKKNLFRLLAAYSEFRSHCDGNDWDLVLLGDGPLRAELLDYVDRMGLTGRVHFLGFRQYEELPVFYALAEAFIHASTTEQWGLVVNEAMASGLPVLVSNRCGCAPDLVRDGINGYSFDPYCVEQIAKRMIQVASDDCDRVAMAAASRRIIGDWSPETFVVGMLRAADAALSAPRPKFKLLDRALLWALMRR